MSMALSSNETWRYWLRRDRLKDEKGKDLPYEKQDPHRQHFLMRHLTGREQLALAAALDARESLPKGSATAEYVKIWFAAARLAGVAGYYGDNGSEAQAGTPLAITAANIDDVAGLGYSEARELAYAAFVGAITPGDLGNSDSPSNTDGAESASPDGAAAEK